MRTAADRVRRWLDRLGHRYREGVAPQRQAVPAVPRPAELDSYENLWVALIDGVVAAAEETSHKLALKLYEMDPKRRERAIVEFVRPTADSYIVGAG
jgi:hypothetical protein